MKEINWVIGVNLLLIFVFEIFVFFLNIESEFGKRAVLLLPIIIQFIGNIIVCIFTYFIRKHELSLAFLLAAFASLLIGSSSCFAFFDI